jgi:hypothetical protein
MNSVPLNNFKNMCSSWISVNVLATVIIGVMIYMITIDIIKGKPIRKDFPDFDF